VVPFDPVFDQEPLDLAAAVSLLNMARQRLRSFPSHVGDRPFNATHEHADGGHYELLGHGKVRMGEAWEAGVFYRNTEGMLFATSTLRWNARFVPLAATDSRNDRWPECVKCSRRPVGEAYCGANDCPLGLPNPPSTLVKR
jgi:hypothetical protein